MPQPEQLRKSRKPPTARQMEIAQLQKIKSDKRNNAQSQRMSELMAEERRSRFLEQRDARIYRLKKAVRRIIQLGNPKSYQYTPEEAEQICAAVRKYAQEMERAFKGAPKEKGLFDL